MYTDENEELSMRMRRAWISTGFAIAAASALLISHSDAKPETVTEILPGIWFREGDLDHLGHCNNQIIEMKDYLIVIDANFPSGARATLADAKRVSRKPVKYVFITHHHGDHLYGSAVWTAEGAKTIAYKGVAEEIRRYEPKRWQEENREDVKKLNRTAPEPPQQTFEKSPFTLDDGTRTVQFYFFGWAHTRGDGFAYLPKEQVLCTGDAIVNGPYNYAGDGNIGNWPNVTRAAARLRVKHVLPGHGVPGGPEIIEGQGRFMTELLNAVKAEVAKGKKLEDLVKLKGSQAVSTTVKLPQSVQRWAGDFYAGQVQDAYLEVTQKKPRGDIAEGR